MEHGININKGNSNNATPLYIACQNAHIDVVKYLVENGTNINKVMRVLSLYVLHVKKDISI